MSCQTGQRQAMQAAVAGGTSRTSSQTGYVAGATAQVSFFVANERPRDGQRRKQRRRKPRSLKPVTGKRALAQGDSTRLTSNLKEKRQQKTTMKSTVQKKRAQVTFFESPLVGNSTGPAQLLPSQRQIKMADAFTPAELQRLSVQLGLGAVAVSRHLRDLKQGLSRDIGHGDPRPADWAQADLRNFQFLAEQVSQVRRGQGFLDTSALKKNQLVDLWEFSQFEADRALRNIDHLQPGLSHLKGPTADYLVEGHQLEARFYTWLAGQLEPVVSRVRAKQA